MKNYLRVMLGKGSIYAQRCFEEGFIGTDYGIRQDLTGKLPDEWRAFNKKFIPVYLEANPGKSRVAAGLACGMTWTVARYLEKGDIILSPDGEGRYHVGEITGGYFYQEGDILPHRRPVRWYEQTIRRDEMSEALRNSAGAIGVTSNLNKHTEEIERLIGVVPVSRVIATTDELVENPSAFEMEAHLQEFLIKNWSHTELGKEYDIYEVDGEKIGKEYPVEKGRIDILAISKDRKTLLVVELKRGLASDRVVGQILYYMGYVNEELVEEGQTVKGIIIALEDDPKIRKALTMTPSIDFYRYQVSFRLVKG